MSSPGPEAISISGNTIEEQIENVWRVPQQGDNMTDHEGSIKTLRVRVVSGTIARYNFSFFRQILSAKTCIVRISLKWDSQSTEILTEYTTTIKKTLNPKWDEEFLFRVDPTKNYLLVFEVFKPDALFGNFRHIIGIVQIPVNHTTIVSERPGRNVACKEYAFAPHVYNFSDLQRPQMYHRGHLLLYLAYVGNEAEIKTSNENPSAPQEDEEGAETRQKYLFQNVCDEETTGDKEEISDSLNEKGGEINEHSNLEESVSKDKEGAETRQKYLFQNEKNADKEEISDTLNEKGGEINEQSNLEESVSKDEEGAETSQKYLFQNVCDEETTEVKEEKSDSLNEKEDDKEETVNDVEETYKHVLDRSISTIKECMNPEPILDSLLEDNVFQYIDIRDIMEKTSTTKKNETIIETVRQNGNDVYKRFKQYLGESHQNLLLQFIEKTEKGEETTDIRKDLKKETRRRLKEMRNKKSSEETSVNLVEEQLVISIQRGNDFEGTEDIEENLSIHTSSVPSSRKCCNVVKGIFEGTVEKYSDQLIKAVNDVASIVNVDIKAAAVDKDNNVVMTMACASCEEIRMLLKILKGNEFKSKIENLKTVLSKEYEIVCVIQAKVSHEKIKEVQQHLMDQGVINEAHADDLFCDTHDKQQVELFCPTHDKFFCHQCVKKHRTCQGVRQTTQDVSTKMYRIRRDEPANKLCTTLRLCTLPSGEILLIDNVNKKLKKLDLTYSVVCQYTFDKPETPFDKRETPFDVCAIHASKAFVTVGRYIYVVNIGDIDIQVEKLFETNLKMPCFRFYMKDNVIYYTDNHSIYTCDEDGKNHNVLHQFEEEIFCNGLVVNDKKSKIAVACGETGLIIIDANSQSQSTVALQDSQDCTDLCIVENEMLLVCASKTLYLVDIEQGMKIKQVAIGLRCPRSIAFDFIDNSVIGGNLGDDFISVFKVDFENGNS